MFSFVLGQDLICSSLLIEGYNIGYKQGQYRTRWPVYLQYFTENNYSYFSEYFDNWPLKNTFSPINCYPGKEYKRV